MYSLSHINNTGRVTSISASQTDARAMHYAIHQLPSSPSMQSAPTTEEKTRSSSCRNKNHYCQTNTKRCKIKRCTLWQRQRILSSQYSVRTLLARLSPYLMIIDMAEAMALSKGVNGNEHCGICSRTWRTEASIVALLRAPYQDGDGDRAYCLCSHVHCFVCLLQWLHDCHYHCPSCR